MALVCILRAGGCVIGAFFFSRFAAAEKGNESVPEQLQANTNSGDRSDQSLDESRSSAWIQIREGGIWNHEYTKHRNDPNELSIHRMLLNYFVLHGCKERARLY